MKLFLACCLCILIFASCEEKMEPESPLFQTGEVMEINSEGATFYGKVLNPSGSPAQYGFVWGLNQNPLYETDLTYIINERNPGIGIISQRIETTLENDRIYYVKAFVKTGGKITYGRAVQFVSKGSVAPGIESFSPASGNLRTTVLIVGKNISNKLARPEVRFGNVVAATFKFTSDSIWVEVPGALREKYTTITVSHLGRSTSSESQFELLSPSITSISPETGTFGTEVTIFGSNFLKHPPSFKILLNDISITPVVHSDSELKVVIPDDVTTQQVDIVVETNNLRAISPTLFEMATLTLSSFSPEEIKSGNLIELYGNNFCPRPDGNVVMIDGRRCTVYDATPTRLRVGVPSAYDVLSSRDLEISVEVLGLKQVHEKKLHITDKWLRLANWPRDLEIYNGTVGAADKFLIVGPDRKNKIARYNTQTGVWSAGADFPGDERSAVSAFSIGEYYYVGCGVIEGHPPFEPRADFWRYDAKEDKWHRIADFPFPTGYATSFSTDFHGFVLTQVWLGDYDYENRLFGYNPASNTWTEYFPDPGISFKALYGGAGLKLGSRAIIGNVRANNSMYIFDPREPTGAQWKGIALFPYQSWQVEKTVSFSSNGESYVLAVPGDLARYNETSDTWVLEHRPFYLAIFQGLTVGNKAYIMTEFNYFWEFDASQP